MNEEDAIDEQICVSDGYCSLIKACPSFERVEIKEFIPTKYQKLKLDQIAIKKLMIILIHHLMKNKKEAEEVVLNLY